MRKRLARCYAWIQRDAAQAKTVDEVEHGIGHGQAEELIAQAESELALVGHVREWKAWQALDEEPVSGQWKWP